MMLKEFYQMNTFTSRRPRLLSGFFLFFWLLGASTASYAHLDLVSTVEFKSRDVTLNNETLSLDTNERQGASGVRSATKKIKDGETTYYFKGGKKFEGAKKHLLFDSIIASRVLNRAFSKDAQRFPLTSLGVDPSDLALFSISEDLKGFKTIVELYQDDPSKAQGPFYENNIKKLKDLGNLYVGLFLVGGGDVHPGNVVYSDSNGFFGDVDLDVAYKQHLTFGAYKIEKEQERFTKSDLALREFDCNDPCRNFLFETDSCFEKKGEWAGIRYKPAYNYAHYKDKIMVPPTVLLEAMSLISSKPLIDYQNSIAETIAGIRLGYQRIAGTELKENLYEVQKLNLAEKRYNLMKYLAERYKQYKATNDAIDEDVLLPLLEEWCNNYFSNKEPGLISGTLSSLDNQVQYYIPNLYIRVTSYVGAIVAALIAVNRLRNAPQHQHVD